MALPILNAEQLHRAILNGCQRIIGQQDALNAINVFPVADRDTGSNMASTAQAVMNYSLAKQTIKDTLQSIAEASLLGARGNSGMIFSQFFNGLTENPPTEPHHIDSTYFKQLLANAASSVRNALQTPIEGTMLTIIETWSTLFNQLSAKTNCFIEITQHLLPDLKQAVSLTTKHLNILQQTNLVDAGALGFYHFVHGFADYLLNPKAVVLIEKPLEIEPVSYHHHHPEMPLTYRYCTEAIIKSAHLPKEKLRHVLSQCGDSVVISGTSTISRFHLHTDNPKDVFSRLSTLGQLEQPKVDDMQRQIEITQLRQASIALVTDSSADLPQEWLDKYQIHHIPLNIHLDNHHLLDGYGFEANHFYQHLHQLKTYPKTAQPNLALIKEKLSHLSSYYDDVLVLPIARSLSGTHDAFLSAKEGLSNVHVIDSLSTSGAQGLLVHHAAQLIAEGLDINTIKTAIEKAATNVNMFIAVEQLDALMRSGRVPALSGKVAQWLGLKPIITLDKKGRGTLCAKALSTSKALTKIIHLVRGSVKHAQTTLKAYCIVHAGVEEKAHLLAKQAEAVLNQPPAYIKPVSTAIGLHAGFGAVAIAFMME